MSQLNNKSYVDQPNITIVLKSVALILCILCIITVVIGANAEGALGDHLFGAAWGFVCSIFVVLIYAGLMVSRFRLSEKARQEKFDELATYPLQILKSRVETLNAEVARKRASFPARFISWLTVVITLLVGGLNFGFGSMIFILPTALLACVSAFGTFSFWALRSNLQISQAALERRSN